MARSRGLGDVYKRQVQGTAIDDHGDAHDEKGFCNAVRKAKVQGSLKGDKFVVTYFELLKVE
jgi:hypothetical protein